MSGLSALFDTSGFVPRWTCGHWTALHGWGMSGHPDAEAIRRYADQKSRFDYLPDDFLVKMLNSLFTMLSPGGKLIAAFKDADRYRAEVYHWLVDWDGFLQRTETDFNRLLRDANIPDNALSTARTDSGSIIFYIAAKP